MSRLAIIVMLKAPRAGGVKTRLMPSVSAEDAAALAECFARDCIRQTRRVSSEVIIAYSPADGRAAIENALCESILPANLFYVEQRGDDLGARLANAIADAYAQGFSPLIVVGTDSPTLPHDFLDEARRVLTADKADVVLGGTCDGGYYTIGLRRPHRALFDGVAWSTAHVYPQTIRNAERINLRVYELPGWYDVDTPADLARLHAELDGSAQARSRAPATFDWLSRHEWLSRHD